MSEEAVTETRFSLKTVALRVFHLPLSWYYSFNQVINTLSKYCYLCYAFKVYCGVVHALVSVN